MTAFSDLALGALLLNSPPCITILFRFSKSCKYFRSIYVITSDGLPYGQHFYNFDLKTHKWTFLQTLPFNGAGKHKFQTLHKTEHYLLIQLHRLPTVYYVVY